MRISPILPQQLQPYQQAYYRQSKRQIAQMPGAAQAMAIGADGALLGPWSVWLDTPELGTAFAALQGTISSLKALSPRAQQVAELLTAARQRAAYELAGHRTLALGQGFTDQEVNELAADRLPATLPPDEQLAGRAAQALLAGGSLLEPLYQALRQTFGPHGPVQLCAVVGQYLFLAVTLNTFDI